MKIGRRPQPPMVNYKPAKIPGLTAYVPPKSKINRPFKNLDKRELSMDATNKLPVSSNKKTPDFYDKNLFPINEGFGNIDEILLQKSNTFEGNRQREFQTQKQNERFVLQSRDKLVENDNFLNRMRGPAAVKRAINLKKRGFKEDDITNFGNLKRVKVGPKDPDFDPISSPSKLFGTSSYSGYENTGFA
jgi:hypothetical protein